MAQQSLLSGSVWLSLPQETRAKIAELFSLSKSGNITVFNGPNGSEVRSDGYTYEDLSVITIESMQEKLGFESDNFYHLFKNICLLVNEEALVEKIEEDIKETVVEEEKVEKVLPKSGKFCDYCDAKSRFHKKECTREQHETKTT